MYSKALSDYKTCARCSGTKATSHFNRDSRSKDGFFVYCRDCWNVLKRTKYKYKEADQKRAVKRNYKLDGTEYDRMLEDQNERCSICRMLASETNGRGKRLQVDHCHSSGKIRGLLCNACNLGLGAFKDDPDRLHRAIEYCKLMR